MKSLRWLAPALVAALCADAARADVVAPGFKFREVRVAIDNLGDYPDHVFYLVVAGWVVPGESASGPGKPQKPQRLTPGEPHRPGSAARWNRSWLLVAVPRHRAEQSVVDWQSLASDNPGVLHSNRVQLSQPSPVLLLWPMDYEVRHYRVELARDQLTLTPGAVEQGSDGFGSWVPGLLTAAAVVALGLWIARRIRRRADRTPAEPG